jgi:hypothetical protein
VSISQDVSAFPVLWSYAGAYSPFVALDRISAQLDRETAALLQQANALQPQTWPSTDSLMRVEAGKLPAGVQDYSFVSTVSGAGVCGKSVQITSNGAGRKPRVVTRTWGRCGSSPSASATTTTDRQPPTTQDPRLLQVRYEGAAKAPPA